MRVLVTGAGGFIGSHVVERFARKGDAVVAVDSFQRSSAFGTGFGPHFAGEPRANWELLPNYGNVKRQVFDISHYDLLCQAVKGVDLVVHTAAQVAVTKSLEHPWEDFDTNVCGTVKLLEAVRKAGSEPVVIFTSTNKVYGDSVNAIPIAGLREGHYRFAPLKWVAGIPEDFGVDRAGHTPYGTSKLAADLYVQEYARTYGMRTGVLRMSCIYGPRQYGVEDQGWVAHFVLSALHGRQLTIYGDGKQVRDVLYVDDLVDVMEAFQRSADNNFGEVFNIGGGPRFTLSLLELLELLKREGLEPQVSYAPWRLSDQKVYVSDVRKAKERLGWEPKVSPEEGVRRLLEWARTLETFRPISPMQDPRAT